MKNFSGSSLFFSASLRRFRCSRGGKVSSSSSYGDILRRSFTSTSSSTQFQPISQQCAFTNLSAFDVPARYSELLGHRSLIIALGEDEESQGIAQHLWMRFQKAGKEAVIMNCRTLFPTSTAIADGIDLARRTGIQSIVTVGNESCIAIGKAIRETLESGLTSNHMSSMLAVRTNTDNATRYVIPLVTIPSNVTPTTAFPIWSGLHNEEDYVQDFACRPPDVVVFDSSLMKDLSLENLSLYLLASLFDIIFSYVISAEYNRKRSEFRNSNDGDDDDSNDESDVNNDRKEQLNSSANEGEDVLVDTNIENFIMEILQRQEFKPILLLLLDIGMLENMKTDQEKVYKICEAINALHDRLFLTSSSSIISGSDIFDPSVKLFSQLSLMRMLHASDTPLNVPYNLLMVDTFQKILRNAALFQNVISEGDSEMEVSARRSFLTTVSILGLSPQGGLAENIMKYNITRGIPAKVRDDLDDMLSTNMNSGGLSAGGVVAGAQFVEESSIEQHSVNVSKAKNVAIKGVYGNKETAEIVAAVQKFSPKLGLLKSDFFLDMVETSF